MPPDSQNPIVPPQITDSLLPQETKVYINGVSGVTGQYLVRPRTIEKIREYVTGEPETLASLLKRLWKLISTGHLGPEPDWKDPKQAGWGIVFHEDEDPAVRKALQPLIDHRCDQLNGSKRFKVMEYKADETVEKFLGRYDIGTGSKDPEKVPYYLLLVGSPERIPFSFGHLLDIHYAVGRLHFDQVPDYHTYARSVESYENDGNVTNSREAVFFGTRHKFDPATILSHDQLVTPLVEGTQATDSTPAITGVGLETGFQIKKLVEKDAFRENLIRIFELPTGLKPPAFLFTASHGVGWPKGDSEQYTKQGALLCQDWPAIGKIKPDHYFSADELDDDSHVQGMICLFFACYSAGTPSHDRFIHKKGTRPPAIAPQAFIGALPKKLLSHPNGGALAVIGHVERAWGYSISTPEAGQQILPFRNAVVDILSGVPVGYAVKGFNELFTFYSSTLTELLENESFGMNIPPGRFADCWVKRNDSQGYVVIGDPAVRLRVNDLK